MIKTTLMMEVNNATITSNEGRVICIAAMHNLALFVYPAYQGLRRLSATDKSVVYNLARS